MDRSFSPVRSAPAPLVLAANGERAPALPLILDGGTEEGLVLFGFCFGGIHKKEGIARFQRADRCSKLPWIFPRKPTLVNPNLFLKAF